MAAHRSPRSRRRRSARSQLDLLRKTFSVPVMTMSAAADQIRAASSISRGRRSENQSARNSARVFSIPIAVETFGRGPRSCRLRMPRAARSPERSRAARRLGAENRPRPHALSLRDSTCSCRFGHAVALNTAAGSLMERDAPRQIGGSGKKSRMFAVAPASAPLIESSCRGRTPSSAATRGKRDSLARIELREEIIEAPHQRALVATRCRACGKSGRVGQTSSR